jgi:HK97 family phage prohead protease
MTLHLTIPLTLKALDDREFEGYGSIFGNEDLGGDIVLPGAFAKSLAQHKSAGTLPQMFWMHDMSMVPGKWLEMHEDDKGLYVKGLLAKTQLGSETRELMKMQAVRGLSIGYQTADATFDKEGRRLLKELVLYEVSPVSLAMNPLAQVTHAKCQLSAAGEFVPTSRQMEEMLRKMNCSRSVSRTLIAKIYAPEAKQADTKSESEWEVASVLDLPVVRDSTWDADAVATSLLDHAGIGTDTPDAKFAKGCFLFTDSANDTEREAYKEPFARLVNGKLHVSSRGLAAAAQRIDSIEGPTDEQKDEARALVHLYEKKLNSGKSNAPQRSGTLPAKPQWDAELDTPETEEAANAVWRAALRGFR